MNMPKFHNPDNLPSAGEPPWRFLVEGENVEKRDEWWNKAESRWVGLGDHLRPSPQSHDATYRTRRPLSTQPEGGEECATTHAPAASATESTAATAPVASNAAPANVPTVVGSGHAGRPLEGEWRANEGYLCCGTLRIARADFDTDPSPEFRREVFEWIADTLNRRPSPPSTAGETPITAAFFNRKPSGRSFLEEVRETMERLERERDAALQQGRCERCVECGGFVSDYVEEESGRGRICRPCETTIALRTQLAAVTAEKDEARAELADRDKQLAEASKTGIDLVARLRQQNHEHAAQRDKREAELLRALKRTPDWDRLFAEAKEKMLNEAVDWTTDPPSQKPGGWWQYTSLVQRAAVVAMLIEIKTLRADSQRLEGLAALATETEFCIQVCCDNITDPSNPAWWLERDDQMMPVGSAEYHPSLRSAIDAARAAEEK